MVLLKVIMICLLLKCCTTSPLTSALNSSSSATGSTLLSSSLRQYRQQALTDILLRFPFVNFLVNPCGLMVSSGGVMSPSNPEWPGVVTARPVSSRDNFNGDLAPPPPMRTLASDGIPIVEQARNFLIPFRDFYVMRSRNQTSEERATLSQELHQAVLVAKHLARHVYQPTTLTKCDGLQLQSLPLDSALVSPTTGEIQLPEVYRGLLISAAHLHLMIRDAYDSARYCPSENRAQHQNIRQLTGKIETLMCLMLHSAVGPEDYDTLNFYYVAQRAVQSTVNRYYDCSAREIRGCLVIRYLDRILGGVEVLNNNNNGTTQQSQ